MLKFSVRMCMYQASAASVESAWEADWNLGLLVASYFERGGGNRIFLFPISIGSLRFPPRYITSGYIGQFLCQPDPRQLWTWGKDAECCHSFGICFINSSSCFQLAIDLVSDFQLGWWGALQSNSRQRRSGVHRKRYEENDTVDLLKFKKHLHVNCLITR